jgi:predicted alpha/beta hydrolase family esterase
MRTAWLLHGSGGNDKDYFWFADTKKYLESKDYQVWWPLLPLAKKQNLDETRSYILKNMPSLSQETIIIGHAGACPVILSFLQSIDIELKQAILVSGFYSALNDKNHNKLLEKDYCWDDIKSVVNEIILINSDNDPWGCDNKHAQVAAKKLNAALVVAVGQGHIGSKKFNQPYSEFPLLKQLLSVN